MSSVTISYLPSLSHFHRAQCHGYFYENDQSSHPAKSDPISYDESTWDAGKLLLHDAMCKKKDDLIKLHKCLTGVQFMIDLQD